MPDWREVLHHRLGKLRLPQEVRQEVIAELASHFEDCERQAEIETADLNRSYWRRLSRAIQHAKCEEHAMNHRTKTLWLPALATFFGASISLALCQYFGMRPSILWAGEDAVCFYWPWLATLPLFGAAGAHLSQRARGAALSRFAAGLSPALIMLSVMLLVLPWGLVIDGVHFLQLVSFGLILISWVVIPSAALLLGALPFSIKPESRKA